MKTDLDILHNVIDQIKKNKMITASVIGVAVMDGIVTLTGNVDNEAQELEAEKAAGNVAGVKGIVRDIKVIASPTNKKTDKVIKQSVLHALKSEATIPPGKIKVNVKGGEVTLEGETDWAYERNAAWNAACSLPGVKCVHNLITIKPRVESFEEQRNANLLLQRSRNLKRGELFIAIGFAVMSCVI